MCSCRVLDAELLLRSGGPRGFIRGHGPLLQLLFYSVVFLDQPVYLGSHGLVIYC
jgi:hypothetical protein